MDEFSALLKEQLGPVTRYVRFRIGGADAEDVLQEVLTAALRAYPRLADKGQFRAWLIGIARHKCADHLRRRYRRQEVPLADTSLSVTPARFSRHRDSLVDETLERLSPTDRTMLRLCYYRQLTVREMAALLRIPEGTVKSRLHAARSRFRAAYPQPKIHRKDEPDMKNAMPDFIPKYEIVRRDDAPFPCKWEEMMGWFIVPKLGESLTWAMYDDPDGRRTEVDHLRVTGEAMVHGIRGVEIEVETENAMVNNQIGGETEVCRTFVAQLTDTHCRYLAETHVQDGVKQLYTFLDGDEFLNNWGFGEDNCGNETDLRVKGEILREGDVVSSGDRKYLLDVVGRYDVTIGGKTWDTICVMDLESYVDGMVTEQYIDPNGRTVLWRRFNADDWHLDRNGGKPWSEVLPDSQRITVNGRTYIHWYDCITSYIL